MPDKPESKRIAPWVWFFNLGLASVFIYFLFFLNSVPETQEIPPGSASQNPAQNAIPPQDTSVNSDQDFSFYELLPETQVTAPKVDAYKPKVMPDNISYLLQTGSFRNYSDAERQRANIAFQGLKAEVRQITLAEENVWYRVQIGPYKSRSKMNSAIDRLVSINIQPLVRKQTLD